MDDQATLLDEQARRTRARRDTEVTERLDRAEQQRDRLLEAGKPVAAMGRHWNEEGNPYLLLPGKQARRFAEAVDEIQGERDA